MAMDRYELHGWRFTSSTSARRSAITISVPESRVEGWDFDLGTVACNCPCHKKPESEVPQ
jgi:hypothetical protein